MPVAPDASTTQNKAGAQYVITWNMQGAMSPFHDDSHWRMLYTAMQQDRSIVAACVQECGVPPGHPPSENAIGVGYRSGGSRQEPFNIYYLNWSRTPGGGNYRCSAAVVTRTNAEDAYLHLTAENRRAGFFMKIDGVWIGSFHATSGYGGPASSSAFLLEVAEHFAQTYPGQPWMVGADYNCQPNQIQQNQYFQVRPPLQTTRRDQVAMVDLPHQKYDYFCQVRRDLIAGGADFRLSNHVGDRYMPHLLQSDHYAQKFQWISTAGQ